MSLRPKKQKTGPIVVRHVPKMKFPDWKSFGKDRYQLDTIHSGKDCYRKANDRRASLRGRNFLTETRVDADHNRIAVYRRKQR